MRLRALSARSVDAAWRVVVGAVLRMHNMGSDEGRLTKLMLARWVQKAGGPAAISMVELSGGNSGFREMNNVRAAPSC